MELIKKLVNKFKGLFKKNRRTEKKEGSVLSLLGRTVSKDYNERYKGWKMPLDVYEDSTLTEVVFKLEDAEYRAPISILKHYGKVIREQEKLYVVLPLRYWTKK